MDKAPMKFNAGRAAMDKAPMQFIAGMAAMDKAPMQFIAGIAAMDKTRQSSLHLYSFIPCRSPERTDPRLIFIF